ncbi:MAG: hypothetical protein HC927_07515 [Deltaproteobacteria bacterium]|nr:hypothetical protein [Deltaproteobacteria bacterium]
MARVYHYVGPPEIREQSRELEPGVEIRDSPSFVAFVGSQSESIFTFTIDERERLRLAPRRSEHVACAGGLSVLAAGELGVSESLTITHLTNQSTGYCPEPESWAAVRRSLERIGLAAPSHWTREYIFRRCPACGERNLVKDGWFVCDLCDAELPGQWNFSAADQSEAG